MTLVIPGSEKWRDKGRSFFAVRVDAIIIHRLFLSEYIKGGHVIP